MANLSIEDDLILEFVAESREHLATIEADLLSMEQAGAAIDEQLVNRVFRAAHSIKGGAGFFDLNNIEQLAHRTETVLDLVRTGQIVPDSEVVSILLLAFDKLRSLVLDYRESNSVDISDFTAALSSLAQHHLAPEERTSGRRDSGGYRPGHRQDVDVLGVRSRAGSTQRTNRLSGRIRPDSRRRKEGKDPARSSESPDQMRHDSGDGV
jgi:chemotaxis protein histidine kinase CheA